MPSAAIANRVALPSCVDVQPARKRPVNRSMPATLAALLAATVLVAHSGGAGAQAPAVCTGPDDTLQPPATPGIDIRITDRCQVKAGTYKFGNVNIVDGGKLIFTDAKIDFWASSILIENGGSLLAGDGDKPIGQNGGALTIHLWGKDQTGNDPNKQGTGIRCLSDDVGQCGVPDEIWHSNMHIPPSQARKVSSLSDANAYPGPKDDYFYAYHPLPFDGGADARNAVGYFGYKVIGVSYGGILQLYGRKGATYATPECGPAPTSSGTSWARLASPAAQDTSALVVDRPLSLKADDQIVVTTTDYLPGHSEQLTVASEVNCGTQITVKEKLKHAHNGARFSLTAVPDEVGLDSALRKDGAETRAAVGLLTRSIRIVSAGDTLNDDFPAEPPVGSTTPGYYFGGHLIVRQGFKVVQIQGVEFQQMGQGGRLGHYPIHFHHARRTNPDTFVRDSSIHDSMTRWIVLHGTQDVTLERNVGYKSIGHGFYLEDGTEINNVLTANLGVFARAAVANAQNPRNVPGILAAPDLHTTTGEAVPYRSDYDHPTIFWIMNGWNDFRDNLAVGAGTCGVCYWLLPGINSGMSREMKWASYASMQSSLDRAGMVPLKSFVGNACSTAMTSFQTITATESCQGVGPGGQATDPLNLPPIQNLLAAPTKAPPGSDAATVAAAAKAAADYYPSIGDGGHFATQCSTEDCSTLPKRCSAGSPDACMVTVLDHYTTSFNWAAFNFAAIWLRPQWYLVTDSVITDSQQAGLTIVTGGGYSDSDVIPGHWALVRKSVFIGNTQENNPYASNGGPFNPKALRCAMDANGNRPASFCLEKDEGVSHQMSNFGMYQRLFSVYDGPAFQDSNAYLNITKRTIDDCKPFVDVPNQVGRCDPPDLRPGMPRDSAWLAGTVQGLPKQPAIGNDGPFCYMPNAAIGWKQPNGFYYPPAFHSANLFFDGVDIRHFVVSPLFVEGTSRTDIAKVAGAYCKWDRTLFNGFAGNDRQTVLNDDDGTLTGYEKTTVINQDAFFAAPVDATQCRSDNTSRTSPYEYVTTVVYPACVIDGTCARPPQDSPPDPRWNDGDWNRSCTNEYCYGVPLWRQDQMPLADKDPVTSQIVDKSIRMMGQQTSQRSSLTVNHGTYYIDTTVAKETQLTCPSTDPANPCVVNVFKPSQTYYLFLIFAKTTTEQTYRFYVGENTDFDPSSIQIVQAQIGVNPVKYVPVGPLPAGRARWLNNDKATANGVVEVDLKVADLPKAADLFNTAKINKCQPKSFCTWNTSTQQCVDASGSDAVCKWAVVDQDCPAGGCFGIRFTLPSGFTTRAAGDPRPDPRPAAVCVAKALPWDVSLDALKLPDGTCPVDTDKQPLNFCQ